MKRKILAIMLTVVMATLMMSGCSKENEIKNAEQIPNANTIYGEISAINENSVTIKIGTMNMEKRGKEMHSGGEILSENETPEQNIFDLSSMIEFTGEEKEIKITDETVIKKQQMGGFGRGNMGNPPEMPEYASRPEMPSGENSQGDPPKMPNKEQGTPPEMPSGEDGFVPDGERGPGGFGQISENISIEDIQEGDIVSIVLNDDKNTKEIIVMVTDEMEEESSKEQESSNSQAKNKVKQKMA